MRMPWGAGYRLDIPVVPGASDLFSQSLRGLGSAPLASCVLTSVLHEISICFLEAAPGAPFWRLGASCALPRIAAGVFPPGKGLPAFAASALVLQNAPRYLAQYASAHRFSARAGALFFQKKLKKIPKPLDGLTGL